MDEDELGEDLKGNQESARLRGRQKSRGRKVLPAMDFQASRVHRKWAGLTGEEGRTGS